MISKSAAAALLGIPAREVAEVGNTPAGDVITTRDGVAYVLVPDDTPDAEGKTGLMLLAAPSEQSVYVEDLGAGATRSWWNGFPLFASDELLDVDVDPDAPPPVDEKPLAEHTVPELKDIAAALGVTGKNKGELIAAIEAKRAETPPPADDELAAAAAQLAGVVAELDELTDDELAAAAEHLGVDGADRDDLVAAVAAATIAEREAA